MLNPERFWSDRPVMAAARIGFPVGALYGVFQTVITGSVLKGLLAAVFFGTSFGGIMAWWMRRAWRGSSELAPEDRVAVARAVYRGEEIQDVRLAGAVVDYAGVVRQACERDARGRWLLVVFAVMTAILAISATVAGSTGDAVVFWVLSVFWVAGLGWILPRRRARMLANAHRAELAARSRRPASGPV
jgi:hypothetical protein